MKRIMLIVDDSQVNCKLLSDIFKDDFTIKTANDGRSALSILGYYGVKMSIVLLDLIMPGMDGFEVLSQMKENPELQFIPVIVVSGKDSREAALAATKLGAADFVSKPIDADWIKMKVEAAINRADSARLRAENEYITLQSAKEAKYRMVLDSTGTVVIEFDRQKNTFQYDTSISKYIAGEFDGRSLWRILMTDMVADVRDVKAMQEMAYNLTGNSEGNENTLTVRLRTPSNKKQWFRMRAFIQPGQDERKGIVILTFNNINSEVETSESLRFQAERDTLTGLYNRTMFFEKAAKMIAEHEPGYYVMTCFDIDKFKVINDQHGSEKGDEILKIIAQVFSEGFSAIGGICSRIMADDFAVLYPVSFMNSNVLAKIHNKLSTPGDDLPTLTFSIGRCIVDDLTLPVSGIYDRAQLAQEAAKERFDHNIITYDESMREQLLLEQRITGEMRNALKADQFEVWFQPQYNHATGALIGSEALVRWRNPKDGSLISPRDFIPIFERNGFIYEMDQYVWEKSFKMLRRWIDENHSPLPISINISRFDVLQDSFFDTLTGLVKKYDLPLDMLRLEITESAFSKDTDHIVRIVKGLIDYGFTVEIDDFGSGYSSLNTLKDVPAHILKLDMRFLEDSEDTDRGGNVLESVVRMAKWLGMAVIAEGVETIEQADYLKSIGCIYVQGYLYEKPMPAHEYETLCLRDDKEDKLLALETVKNLDNNAFWNPKSMDTLVFNSFLGAANIAEYHNGVVEIIRVSEKFVHMFGSKSMSSEDALKFDWMKYITKQSYEAYCAGVALSIETGDETTVECVFADVPGCPKRMHLRTTLRVIATAGNRYLLYCLNENITEQRMTEEKEQEANELLRAIMENMSGGVNLSVIRSGVPKVQIANRQYYETRGYTREQYEAEVDHLSKIIHPEDRQMMFHATSTAKKPFSIMYRIVRRDGAVRWVINNVAFVNLPGFNEPVQLSVSNDITELREAEEKERASAEQLRIIMANINGGVTASVIKNGVAKILFANERFYRQYGYTKEQFEAEVKNPNDLLHPDDKQRVVSQATQASKTNEPYSIVYRIIRRDGSICWLQTNVTVMRLPGVKAPVQFAVAADITVQKELEEKERANAQQLQAIMDNINGGVAMAVIRDGFPKVIFANEQFYAQRGYTKEQYEAEHIEPGRIFHKDDVQMVSDMAKTVSGSHSAIYRIIRRDGEVRWLQNNITEVVMPGYDEPVKLSVSNDITELRQAERKQHEVSERMQAILGALNSGVSGITVSGDGELEYIFANDMYYTMLGYTKEQFDAEVGDGLKLVHPDDRSRVEAQLDELNRSGGTTMFEYRVFKRDGELAYLRVSASRINLDGVDRPVNLGVSVDVTDLVMARQQIAALSERLQAVLDNMDNGITASHITDDKIEYLFGNDQFYRLHGFTREQFRSEVPNIFNLVCPDDRNMVIDNVYRVNKTGEGVTMEYRIARRDKTIRWLRTSLYMRELADGPNPVQFAIYNDITEERIGSEKLRAINEQLQFLNDTASELLTRTDAVSGIKSVLEIVLNCFGADRAFIIEQDARSDMLEFTYEACKDGVQPCREKLPRFPKDNAWYWREAFKKDRFLMIDDVDELGPGRSEEAEMMRSFGAKTALAVSLNYAGRNIGTLGVFNPTLHFDDYENLRALADYMSITLTRRDLNSKIASDREMLQTMMDDMPGGFARLRVLPSNAVATVYANKNVCRTRGMSLEEILEADGQNAMSTIHPDDLELVKSTIEKMVQTGEIGSVKYRFKHANGSYIPVSAFGRVTTGDDGAKYINVYYAEISEQEKKEQTIRETVPLVLSAILASSTSLAYAKDLDFRYICASGEFVRAAHSARAEDIIGKTDYEIFPKEVADMLRGNDMKALETDLPLLDYVQALPDADGGLRYYKQSKYILRDTYGNKLGIYGIGRDITDEKSAYARLKLLVDSIPGGIASYVASKSGIKITYFNDGFCNMLGYTRDEYERISATGIVNVTFAQDIPLVMNSVQALIRDNTPLDCTYRVHTKSGGYKWVNLRGSVAERHGDVCLLNGVLYDVTERKEAEDALRISEEQFRIAAAVGGRMVARYDIKTGVYQHASQYLLGKGFKERIEDVPKAFIDAGVISPQCQNEYLEFYDNIRRGVSPCSVDIAVAGENGEWRWFREEANVMLDAEGNPSQAVIVFSDITRLR